MIVGGIETHGVGGILTSRDCEILLGLNPSVRSLSAFSSLLLPDSPASVSPTASLSVVLVSASHKIREARQIVLSCFIFVGWALLPPVLLRDHCMVFLDDVPLFALESDL